MNTARVDVDTDRLGPPAQAPPRIDPRVPVVAALLCAVFACFFLIGRATRTGSSARSEVPSTLPLASVRAAIPVRLTDAQPIYVPMPPPRAPHRAPPRPAPAPERVGPVFARARTPVRVSAPAPSAPAPSAPVPEPTRSISPAPSEAPPPAAAPPSSSRSSGGGGGRTPSTGGGGSFDSSG
jgi:uncharacterized membrane protein YgcG